MKILIVSSEVYPFAKTGGMADVCGALPLYLAKQGVDVRVIMPKYRIVDEYCKKNNIKLKKVCQDLEVNIGWRKEKGDIYHATRHTPHDMFFLDKASYFDRPHLYGDKHGDYKDNAERFSFFSKAVLEFIKKKKWWPDVIHCHDWQTALVCAYIKMHYIGREKISKIKTLYTIHNLAYQGVFSDDKLNTIGISHSEFTMDKLEFYGKVSLKKAGLVYADKINTVSARYAKEIQTKEFGCGLEGVLSKRKKDLTGILNGIDYDVWNPVYDRKIFVNYTKHEMQGKKTNKIEFKKICGFEEDDKKIPLLGIVSRLADQKGFDILAEAIDEIMRMKLQIVLLGTGSEKYHKLFRQMQKKYPDHIKVFLKYDALVAQQIYAASDMFLMPSHFEPCGLGQLIALKYGTIPIVNKTGGLADTINKDNGFLMSEYSAKALVKTIKEAVSVYRHKNMWHALMYNAMSSDFSWKKSAKKYVRLYEKIIV